MFKTLDLAARGSRARGPSEGGRTTGTSMEDLLLPPGDTVDARGELS